MNRFHRWTSRFAHPIVPWVVNQRHDRPDGVGIDVQTFSVAVLDEVEEVPEELKEELPEGEDE